VCHACEATFGVPGRGGKGRGGARESRKGESPRTRADNRLLQAPPGVRKAFLPTQAAFGRGQAGSPRPAASPSAATADVEQCVHPTR
jgi:hypothetical protein